MPLTQEEITQLSAAITEGTDITTLEFIKPITGAGLVIKTDGQLKTEEKALTDKVVKEMHTTFEQVIAKTTGIPKQDGEKSLKFFERAFGEKTNELNQKVTSLTSDLDKASKAGDSDKVKTLSGQLEAMQAKLESTTTEYETLKTESAKAIQNERFNNAVAQGLGNLRGEYNKLIPESVIKAAEKSNLSQFREEYEMEIVNEKPVWKEKSTGLVAKDRQTGEPLPVDKILKDGYFKDFIAVKQQSNGTGMNPDGSGKQQTTDKANGDPKKYSFNSAEIKTKPQLREDLLKHGFAQGTAAFNEVYNTHEKDLDFGF